MGHYPVWPSWRPSRVCPIKCEHTSDGWSVARRRITASAIAEIAPALHIDVSAQIDGYTQHSVLDMLEDTQDSDAHSVKRS